MQRPTFFRLYENGRKQALAASRTFVDVFRVARDMFHIGKPHCFTFVADYADDARIYIPQPVYALPVMCSRMEAELFIYKRIERVKQHEALTNRTNSILRSLQNERCSYEDPIEQQIRDYIATCPWRWRSERDVKDLDFLRFETQEECRHCDKPLSEHPFAQFAHGVKNPRLRQSCDGTIFVL